MLAPHPHQVMICCLARAQSPNPSHVDEAADRTFDLAIQSHPLVMVLGLINHGEGPSQVVAGHNSLEITPASVHYLHFRVPSLVARLPEVVVVVVMAVEGHRRAVEAEVAEESRPTRSM